MNVGMFKKTRTKYQIYNENIEAFVGDDHRFFCLNITQILL